MPDRAPRPELFMPVSDEGAALQFFVEAMKANTATLQQVGKTMEGMQREQSETLKLVHDTRERIIKIESNRVNADVTALKAEVEDLKEDKFRREGAMGLTNWFFRNWPTLVGMIILAGIVLKANGKI